MDARAALELRSSLCATAKMAPGQEGRGGQDCRILLKALPCSYL